MDGFGFPQSPVRKVLTDEIDRLLNHRLTMRRLPLLSGI
jgi:hypothetical protein